MNHGTAREMQHLMPFKQNISSIFSFLGYFFLPLLLRRKLVHAFRRSLLTADKTFT